jgi:hypothetical protein
LLGAAGEAAALPDLAIGKHRQRRITHGIAMADARGRALHCHLEGVAPIEVAISGARGSRRHLDEVAAKRGLSVKDEELAGNILRRRPEADGRVLRGRGRCSRQRQSEGYFERATGHAQGVLPNVSRIEPQRSPA